MTWTAFHRRGDVLRTVAEEVDRRRDGILPMDLPGVAETFHDELDLLSALSLRWHARLSGNVERCLMDQPLDLEAAVSRAWQRTRAQLPGIRAVLDHYLEHPTDPEMAAALAVASEKECAGLAIAAGLASSGGPAAAQAGRELLGRSSAPEATGADAEVGAPASTPVSPASSPSLVERIKAVIAA